MVQAPDRTASRHGLENHGVHPRREVFWNLTASRLYEEAIRRAEGELASHGPLSVSTGQYTGRSPKDKFFVRQSPSDQHIWWGPVNQPFDADAFDALHQRVADHLSQRDLFVQDL